MGDIFTMQGGIAHMAQVRVVWSLSNEATEAVNVLHFATDTEIHDDDFISELRALANAVGECAINHLLPILGGSVMLKAVEAKQVFPTLRAAVAGDAVAQQAGALTGEQSASAFVAMKVKIHGRLAGKHGRGRILLPPPTESHINEEAIDGPAFAAILGFATCMAGKFLTRNATTIWRLGIMQRAGIQRNQPYPTANFFEALELVGARAVSSCVHRKLGRGA